MTYLVCILAGMIVGILIGVWVDKDYVMKVAKFKVKGKGHTIDYDVTPSNPQTKKEARKQRRQQRQQ